MDCIDCHNRPAHTFSFTPERAVDAAIADGRIPRDLPFVRREAVAAVRAAYADKDAALAGIASALERLLCHPPRRETRASCDGRLPGPRRPGPATCFRR